MKNILLLTLCAGFLFSCKSPSDTKAIEEEPHDHGPNDKEEVHLVQQQMDVMDIQMGHFQYLNLSTTVKSNGKLELPPQNKASISSIVGGRVKEVNGIEGDYVQKGQVLASLEHPDFIKMQEEYIKQFNDFRFMEKEMERKSKLFADSISSAKEFQKAEADYQSAKAAVLSLRSQLNLLGMNANKVENGFIYQSIPIASPIKGYLRKVEVNLGKYVNPEQEMFEVIDNDHIHIDLMVYEKDINKIAVEQKVDFSLSHIPDSVFEGRVFAVGRSFENEPKAMVVHAEIDNKKGTLLPGMYVDARIITDERKVRSLPDDAIVNDGGLSYIFVLVPPDAPHQHEDGEEHKDHEDEYHFRKIEVSLGASDIGFTEVVPAYSFTDKVNIVTKGAYYLLAEMKKGEGGHGHHH